jgi:hypothetical protein
MIFTEADHSYIDNLGRRYTSASAMFKTQFPTFDAQTKAAELAARTGQLEMQVLAEWDANSRAACAFGTKVHSFAEATLLGKAAPTPTDEREATAFQCAARASRMLQDRFDLVAVEQVVFDPLYCVAGTLDILMREKATGRIWIFDWKTNKEIRTAGFRGEMGLDLCANLPSCESTKYALQLSIYQHMLTDMEIFPAGTEYGRALIHIPPMQLDPVWIPVPDLTHVAAKLIDRAWRRNPDARQGRGIPKEWQGIDPVNRKG